MENEEFEEQLEKEKLEKIKEEDGANTYTDKDGTVFEWDSEKKAWFPKIDDDFIARYQMQYGVSEENKTTSESGVEGDENKTTSQSGVDDDSSNYQYSQEYYDYYQNYYNYYNTQSTDGSTETGSDANVSDDKTNVSDKISEGSEENMEGKTDSEQYQDGDHSAENDEYYQQYHEYYKHYYGDDYHKYYDYYAKQYHENKGQTQESQEGQEEGQEGGQGSDDKKKGGKGKKRKMAPEPKKPEVWFEVDETKNTNVYVSGLPTDITQDEYTELMNKCGLIMYDPFTKQPKLKLYKDADGQLKGDGLCCYIKVESVNLALQILDGSDFRGHTIHIEPAKFELKGHFDPKKRKRLSNKDKRKLKEKQKKLFDWRPEKTDDVRFKFEKVVVLKNMFTPKDFEEDPVLINELRDDVRSESSKFGDVKSVKIFDNHPEGVMTVTFKDPEHADACIEALNGRWFSKRKISAETWDGQTKFEIEESEAERDKRLQKWENFLESGETKSDDGQKKTDVGKASESETTTNTEGSAKTEEISDNKPLDDNTTSMDTSVSQSGSESPTSDALGVSQSVSESAKNGNTSAS